MAKKKQTVNEPLEKQLWKAADKLRKSVDAAEYKHVVLGLIFLRYISVSFEDLYNRLKDEVSLGADPEDREEYKAENVFYVPAEARWSTLVSKAKDPMIGKIIDGAMDAIEKDNPSLKGVLPKVFARPNLDPASLGELIDLVGNCTLNASTNSATCWDMCLNISLANLRWLKARRVDSSILRDALWSCLSICLNLIRAVCSTPVAVLAECSCRARSLSRSIRAWLMIYLSTDRRATRQHGDCAR